MSRAQQMSALARANEVKTARGVLRRSIKAGETSLADALEHPVARPMQVWQLVRCQHRWGDAKIFRLAAELDRQKTPVPWMARVRMLTVKQRLALLAGIEGMPGNVQKPKPRPVVLPTIQPRKPSPPRSEPLGDGPPRCWNCKARLLKAVPSGMCRFCEIELAEEAA